MHTFSQQAHNVFSSMSGPLHHALRSLILVGALTALVIFSCGNLHAQTKKKRAASTETQPSNQTTPERTDAAPSVPEDNQPKRLILKDGSYQPTVRWEIRGDRVRYFSAERYQWEELPRDMVDWEATERYFKERNSPRPKPEVAQADEEERADRAAADAANPEAAPGLRLPDGGGVYLLDVYRDRPELVELVQNGGQVNRNTKRNVLRAAINPLAKTKQTIELPGLRARIQAHVADPVVYLNIDQDQDPSTGLAAGDASQRFRIVRVRPTKKSRVVGTIEFAIYSGTAQRQDLIKTVVTPIGAQWIKVAPAEPLTPGEYAVVEMLGKDVNLYVWDFGVDPTAPENPATWTPEPPRDTRTGTRDIPVLKKPEN